MVVKQTLRITKRSSLNVTVLATDSKLLRTGGVAFSPLRPVCLARLNSRRLTLRQTEATVNHHGGRINKTKTCSASVGKKLADAPYVVCINALQETRDPLGTKQKR
ncbi:hypothetical protein EYF80_030216 [Liparis tanakae]|uniref:Uncharacterized protein n=1 Tax=Liparis tanakae TaxID=230148 RepID=A0A4Z2H1C7_9TELE|nr:hypothetical protein EYF80_030216 [Liparis tanakae]